MEKIRRLLVIGLGSIGKRHFANIRLSYPKVEIIILSTRQSLLYHEGCLVVHDLQDAIEIGIQAAFICTPSAYHLDIVNKLVENDIHIFIEKPISATSYGLIELNKKANEKNLKIMVGYNFRFTKSLIFFRSLIRSFAYGKTLCVKAEVGQYLPDWRPGIDYRESASAKKALGGGALLELSHEFDYLSWIFGKPVFSSGISVKVSDLDIDVDDLVIASAGFERNKILTNATIHLDFLQRKPFRQCKAICEGGSIVWDAVADKVTLFSYDDVVLFQGEMDRNLSYLEELKAFFEAVEFDLEVPISIEDGLRTMKIIESVRTSSNLRHQ